MPSDSPRDARFSRIDAKRLKTNDESATTSNSNANANGAPVVVTNAFLAQLHAERAERRGARAPTLIDAQRARAKDDELAIRSFIPSSVASTSSARAQVASEVAARASAKPATSNASGDLRLLTYNVWFGNVAVMERLEALGRVIAESDPHVLCLQEVTPQSLSVLRAFAWFGDYVAGPAPHLQEYFSLMMFKKGVDSELVKREKFVFRNSRMGRYLDVTSYMRDAASGAHFAVGTAHLESYISSTHTSASERKVQIAECFSVMNKHPNAVFMGDTNWDDKDGAVPAPSDWRDAWLEKRPKDAGFTYDAKTNAMLRGYLQKRLDRAFVKLRDFDIRAIEMVGQEPIPGVTYHKTVSERGKAKVIELPVVPSDHFGLLLTLQAKKKTESSNEPSGVVDQIDLT